jgi:NifB/MoaA-like Fe-S oxidoreductase
MGGPGAGVYGSDELYMRAGEDFPPAHTYDGFEQVENGVGAVRYLESLIAAQAHTLPSLAGRRVLVLTGTAMGPLMPTVLEALAQATGGQFECVAVENTYFGSSVTTAGLLAGADLSAALAARGDYDLALLPAESVNEDGLFVDDFTLAALVAATPVPVVLSYHFTDALGVEVAA